MPNIGKVASGTASTNFTVNAASGSISIGSGGAQFIPYNATRSSFTTITINCSGGKKCHSNNVTVTITAGAAGSDRLGAINGFEADFTGGATAQLNSGATSQSCSSCSSMTMTLKPVATSGNSGSATFHLGLTVPVLTSGTLGTGTASYTISASGSGYTTGTGSAAVQSTVEGKLGMTKTSDLRFGTVVLIAGQSGTMTWDAANQTLSTNPASGLVFQKGTTSIGQFQVTGTPSQTLHFTLTGNAGLPSAIRLTNSRGMTLDVTPSTTAQSSQSIPFSGAFTFYLGGTVNISPTMNTGDYSGTVTVTANYE